MSNYVRDFVGAESSGFDFAEFELGLLSFQFFQNESSLDIVQNTEILLGLFQGHNVHKAGGEAVVLSQFIIDLKIY